ncbi:uncharacterized protein C8Q71DRAFT_785796 [Rhodofomes roseus]|uniref:F-box domain-containing protein n=1 Tax=Rhodofomes roseus TaxID=34475 RepID=A0ABQ8K295_9APHY|nr:uncharacterized protein C8Q71DRAFT_785796 [Rhodofomes roseus]KAH9830432.1 hypothetical protein C8Q71DRAFT_785796 [Rhodofomes roseus]
MPASFLSLNDDVLAVLVSYLSSQDARQLSYTTRAVHVVAAHRALQFVSLRSFSTVVRFCAYMLGKMQHRVFALRELRIHCTIARASEVDTASQTAETYAKGAASLVKMLEGAPRLRVFALDCAEYWMEYQTRLVDVLCTMTHLTEVDIQVVGPHAARFINNMEATPHKLILRPPRRRDRRAWPTETTDSRLNPELRLPSVKYLAATDCVNLPGANFLAQMFPSTRSLDIRYEGIDHGQPVELNWPTLEYVRARGHAFASWRNVSAIHLLELAYPRWLLSMWQPLQQ